MGRRDDGNIYYCILMNGGQWNADMYVVCTYLNQDQYLIDRERVQADARARVVDVQCCVVIWKILTLILRQFFTWFAHRISISLWPYSPEHCVFGYVARLMLVLRV